MYVQQNNSCMFLVLSSLLCLLETVSLDTVNSLKPRENIWEHLERLANIGYLYVGVSGGGSTEVAPCVLKGFYLYLFILNLGPIFRPFVPKLNYRWSVSGRWEK